MTIERIETARPSLVAYRVRGEITKDAIETMAREVRRDFEREGEIDLMVILPEWEETEASAWLSRERMAVQAQSVRHVRRYAVVGAPRWAEAMISVFGALLPLEARTFEAGDEAAAWAWVESPPAPGRRTAAAG